MIKIIAILLVLLAGISCSKSYEGLFTDLKSILNSVEARFNYNSFLGNASLFETGITNITLNKTKHGNLSISFVKVTENVTEITVKDLKVHFNADAQVWVPDMKKSWKGS